jgi:hypothetical protein
MTLPPRLSHLLQLADQGPTLRQALAEEVADLLADWPADYPAEMRGVCEDLLAKALQDSDAATRQRLRARLEAPQDAPSGNTLVAAARRGRGLAEKLAQTLEVTAAVAEEILRDTSGKSLALAAKAAHLGRSEFSALVLLAHPKANRATAYARLEAFDLVAMADATRALRAWRSKQSAAAE